MAQGLEQAQRERALTKQAFERTAARLEQRVRRELDWRRRLRHDLPRVGIVAAAGAALVTVLVVLRSRLRAGGEEEAVEPTTLEDVVAELQALRKEVKRGEGGGTVQKVLLRAVAAAGSAGGSYAAKRMLDVRGAKGEAEPRS